MIKAIYESIAAFFYASTIAGAINFMREHGFTFKIINEREEAII